MPPVTPPVYRAPMRARDRDLPPGAGAEFGLEHGLVGIGDAPHDAKAARMLQRFTELDDGDFVWTRDADGWFHLGRISGPYRHDDGPVARAVGLPHVRPARWLDRRFAPDAVPAAVADTFARGGRNLQRISDPAAAERTSELWATYS